MEPAVEVLRVPAAWDGGVIDDAVRRGTFFQGIQIDKRFERRTRLPFRHDGTVELVRPASADHGLDVARLRIDGDDGRLRLLQLVVVRVIRGRQGGCFFSGLLHVRIQGGIDLESLFIHRVRTEFVDQDLDAVIDEVALGTGIRVEALIGQLLSIRFFVLFRRYEIVFLHLAEDRFLSFLGCLRVGEGVEIVRALGDAGDHGRFSQVEVFHVFPEVRVGRRFHTVGTLTEINLIHVHFEDFLLCVLLLDLEGNECLMDLTGQRAFLGQKIVLGQLLGDRTAALDFAVADIRVDGTPDSFEVDPAVMVKTDVFGGKKRILQILRHFVNGDRDTVLFRVDRRDQVTVGIEKLGRSHGNHVLGQDFGCREFCQGKESCYGQKANKDQGKDGRKDHAAELFPFSAPFGAKGLFPALITFESHRVSS